MNGNDWYCFLFITMFVLMFSTFIFAGCCIGAAEESKALTIADFTNELLKKVNATTEPLEKSDAIAKAESLGIMEENEYGEARWDERITRQTAAKLVGRTLLKILKETDNTELKPNIPDYNDICRSCRPYVSLLYAKGILQGYPDGSFCGSNYLTSAEKDLIFERLINYENRIIKKQEE